MSIEQVSLTRIKIDGVEILLEDRGPNAGQITITGIRNNYSYFWGSMGGTLAEFLCSINKEYFASKLMGSKSDYVMDVKKTFAEIRKFIREDFYLPWYKYMEFQKSLREHLKNFQQSMEYYPSQDLFIERWYRFIDQLDYHLVPGDYDEKRVRADFKNISEPWSFIQTTPGPEYLWLMRLHGKIKNLLTTNSTTNVP